MTDNLKVFSIIRVAFLALVKITGNDLRFQKKRRLRRLCGFFGAATSPICKVARVHAPSS